MNSLRSLYISLLNIECAGIILNKRLAFHMVCLNLFTTTTKNPTRQNVRNNKNTIYMASMSLITLLKYSSTLSIAAFLSISKGLLNNLNFTSIISIVSGSAIAFLKNCSSLYFNLCASSKCLCIFCATLYI